MFSNNLVFSQLIYPTIIRNESGWMSYYVGYSWEPERYDYFMSFEGPFPSWDGVANCPFGSGCLFQVGDKPGDPPPYWTLDWSTFNGYVYFWVPYAGVDNELWMLVPGYEHSIIPTKLIFGPYFVLDAPILNLPKTALCANESLICNGTYARGD